MNQEFKKAVDEKNLASVRMMLSNELLFDPRGKSFEGMLRYAKDNLPDLFVEEKPSRFSIPAEKEKWDENVLSQMKRDLNMNFSVEKLALFVEMAKYVGADKAEEMEEEEHRANTVIEDSKKEEKEPYHRTRKSSSRKKTGTIVTGSGAVIAVSGLLVEGALGTVLSVLGGVVAIGGVILLATPEKRNDGK